MRRGVVAVDHLDHHPGRLVTEAANDPTAGDVGPRGGAAAQGAGRDGEGLHRFLRRVVGGGLVQGVQWLPAAAAEHLQDLLLRHRLSFDRVAAEAGGHRCVIRGPPLGELDLPGPVGVELPSLRRAEHGRIGQQHPGRLGGRSAGVSRRGAVGVDRRRRARHSGRLGPDAEDGVPDGQSDHHDRGYGTDQQRQLGPLAEPSPPFGLEVVDLVDLIEAGAGTPAGPVRGSTVVASSSVRGGRRGAKLIERVAVSSSSAGGCSPPAGWVGTGRTDLVTVERLRGLVIVHWLRGDRRSGRPGGGRGRGAAGIGIWFAEGAPRPVGPGLLVDHG